MKNFLTGRLIETLRLYTLSAKNEIVQYDPCNYWFTRAFFGNFLQLLAKNMCSWTIPGQMWKVLTITFLLVRWFKRRYVGCRLDLYQHFNQGYTGWQKKNGHPNTKVNFSCNKRHNLTTKFGVLWFLGIANLQKKFGDSISKIVDFFLMSNFC